MRKMSILLWFRVLRQKDKFLKLRLSAKEAKFNCFALTCYLIFQFKVVILFYPYEKLFLKELFALSYRANKISNYYFD
jgi:hypothetical protein